MAEKTHTIPLSRARPVRFRLGLKRITGNTRATQHPSAVGSTLGIRAQMKALEDTIAKVIRETEDATIEALGFALQPIDTRMHELVPVDTGDLIESSYYEFRQGAAGPEAELGFARGGVPFYATMVHENLEVHHEAPTQAKFLEQAVAENIDQIQERMLEYLRWE